MKAVETLSEKGVKYMEIFNAELKREEQKTTLILNGRNGTYEITLTEDNPNSVKAVFNKLLADLKIGLFTFNLVDDREDLYHQISKEYIKQLNSELNSIYEELKDYELLSD